MNIVEIIDVSVPFVDRKPASTDIKFFGVLITQKILKRRLRSTRYYFGYSVHIRASRL